MQNREKLIGKIFLFLCIGNFLLCSCSHNTQPSQSDLPDYDGQYELMVGILYQETSEILYYDDLGTCLDGTCDENFMNEILQMLQSGELHLEKTIFEGTPGDYEIVMIFPASEYYKTIRSHDEPKNPLKSVLSLAYSYQIQNVYLFWNNDVYLIHNPDTLQKKIGTQLALSRGKYSDSKLFWYVENNTVPSEIQTSSNINCNFAFRYERYWAIDQELQEDDFTMLENYHASNVKEMIDNSANCLEITEYKAYLANDKYTGNWRVEISGIGIDSESDQALLYFDNSYRLIWGFCY